MKNILIQFIKEAINDIKDKKQELKSKIFYTAIVLDQSSQTKLMSLANLKNPGDWISSQIGSHGHEQLNHHMTLTTLSAEKTDLIKLLGKKVNLTIDKFGTDRILGIAAWHVQNPGSLVTSDVPHITALLRDNGIKPLYATKITKWTDLTQSISVNGTIVEVLENGKTNPKIN